MNVILTGASGVVGQGVLIECLRDPRVASVVSLGRSPSGRDDPKLTDLVVPDMADVSAIENQLHGKEACFYCAGAGIVGSSLREYRSVTFDMTLHVAQTFARANPGMTFVYVSGAGSDPHSPVPWLRIKGEIEVALQALPLRAVMFRAGGVQPVNEVRSSHGWLRAVYAVGAPALSLASRYLPNDFTTTERMGRAMIEIAAQGRHASPVVVNAEINRLGAVSGA
ncbi:MAG: oxidoreductase [Luteimonas sp.]